MDSDTRRTNLQRLIDGRFAGSQITAAASIGVSQGRVAQLLAADSVFGERAARSIEQKLFLPPLSLDKRTSAQTGVDPDLDRNVSLQWRETPPHIKWGAIASMAKMPAEFQTTLPDDAMGPRAPKGAVATFKSSDSAAGGDGVLVRDKRGHLYFREYRIKAAGGFIAHAEDPAFPSLDSIDDDLQVIGVFTGIRIAWQQLRR